MTCHRFYTSLHFYVEEWRSVDFIGVWMMVVENLPQGTNHLLFLIIIFIFIQAIPPCSWGGVIQRPRPPGHHAIKMIDLWKDWSFNSSPVCIYTVLLLHYKEIILPNCMEMKNISLARSLSDFTSRKIPFKRILTFLTWSINRRDIYIYI